MGISYTVPSLWEEVNSPDGREWLAGIGLKDVFDVKEGRFPSLKEILTVIQTLHGYKSDSHINPRSWLVFIEEDIPVSPATRGRRG